MPSFPGKSAWLSEFPCLASSSFFSLPPFALFRPVLHRRPFIRFHPIHSVIHSFSLYLSILSPLHSFPSSSCSFFLTSVLRIVTSADPRLRSFCRLSPFLTDGPLSSASSSSQHPASRRRLRGHSHINLLLDGSLKRPASFSLSLSTPNLLFRRLKSLTASSRRPFAGSAGGENAFFIFGLQPSSLILLLRSCNLSRRRRSSELLCVAKRSAFLVQDRVASAFQEILVTGKNFTTHGEETSRLICSALYWLRALRILVFLLKYHLQGHFLELSPS